MPPILILWSLILLHICAQTIQVSSTTSLLNSASQWFGPTPAPSTSLSCTGGSTVLTTRDCTYGFPVSYCHSDPPPLECSSSSYPAWIQARCYSWQACFPVPTSNTYCGQGQVPWHTYTDFVGTLAGGVSTTITALECNCQQGWVSWQQTEPYSFYCLPTANAGSPCADYFTSSASTYSYTVSSSVTTVSRTYCGCSSGQTPSYSIATGVATCVVETPGGSVTTQ